MSAIDTLRANNPENFIAKKYIQDVLKEAGQSLFESQDRKVSSTPVDARDILDTRSFTVTNQALSLRHALRERFLDMKPRYKAQKQVKIHNTFIWTEFNIIAGKIAYGYTQMAKRLIAQKYNVEI